MDCDRHSARTPYEGGIGSVIDNDFVILAQGYFSVDPSVVATIFLIGYMAIPLMVFLVFFYALWLRKRLDRLLRY